MRIDANFGLVDFESEDVHIGAAIHPALNNGSNWPVWRAST